MSTFNPVPSVQLLLDEAGGAIFFTVEQICDALNESQIAITALGKWAPSSLPMTFPQGTDLFSLPSTAMMIPQAIIIGGSKFFFTTHARLEQYDRQWRLTPQGQPLQFILWDVNTLRLFPNPDIVYPATLWGIPYPATEIASVNDTLDLPPLLQEVLIYRAVSELLEHTHPNLADEYASKSDEYLNKFRIQLRRRQSHNIAVFRPATTRFQIAQQGEVNAASKAGGVNPLTLPLIWDTWTTTWDGNTQTWDQT